MKCTVLGGHGFIGQHLVRYLESVRCDVWVPERDEPNLLLQPLGQVFYCIGLTADFRTRPFDTVRAHVTVLSELLEQASFDGLVYLSSTRVYARSDVTREDAALTVLPQDPSDLYNISKLLGESLCRSAVRSGVKIARLSNVIGSRMGDDNFVGAVLKEARSGAIRLKTHPDSAKDYILVDDVVRLLLSIARDGRESVYNVASGVQITHGQWLSSFQDIFGCAVKVDNHSASQSFPVINIDRIKTEFAFEAASILDTVPQLVKTW